MLRNDTINDLEKRLIEFLHVKTSKEPSNNRNENQVPQSVPRGADGGAGAGAASWPQARRRKLPPFIPVSHQGTTELGHRLELYQKSQKQNMCNLQK